MHSENIARSITTVACTYNYKLIDGVLVALYGNFSKMGRTRLLNDVRL